MKQPRFILVRPQLGENIGASARAMLNFGLDQLHLIAPRDGWPNPAAVAMASGAGRLLDQAELHETTDQAIADVEIVFATTARRRGLSKEIITPEEAMKRARRAIAQGKRVACLFGPERSGLENDDIIRANAIISIPVNPEFASLNLAQSVLLLGYEWIRTDPERQQPEAESYLAGSEPITQEERRHLADHYETQLDEAGFFRPIEKAPGMKANLRNFWARMPLSRADLQLLHGMMRQMRRWKERD